MKSNLHNNTNYENLKGSLEVFIARLNQLIFCDDIFVCDDFQAFLESHHILDFVLQDENYILRENSPFNNAMIYVGSAGILTILIVLPIVLTQKKKVNPLHGWRIVSVKIIGRKIIFFWNRAR